MPRGKGLWPAFWMMPTDETYGGWPLSGEIDISEVIGDKPNITYGTLHYGDKWPKNVHSGDKFTLPRTGISARTSTSSPSNGRKARIRWYVDDKLVQTQTQWRHLPVPRTPRRLTRGMQFHLQRAPFGGAWPGSAERADDISADDGSGLGAGVPIGETVKADPVHFLSGCSHGNGLPWLPAKSLRRAIPTSRRRGKSCCPCPTSVICGRSPSRALLQTTSLLSPVIEMLDTLSTVTALASPLIVSAWQFPLIVTLFPACR